MLNATTAALVAHVAFWVLLAIGSFRRELSLRGVLVFVVLWAGACAGLRAVEPVAVVPAIAMLDIALVLTIFKGDVRLG